MGGALTHLPFGDFCWPLSFLVLLSTGFMEENVGFEEFVGKEPDRSSSPTRRIRIFDDKMRNLCWQKADVVAGRHPERWRKDSAGNIVCRKLTRCEGCLCYEYDHIRPFSKGPSLSVCLYLWFLTARNPKDSKTLTDLQAEFLCEIPYL